ncbi:4-hydroxy-tetrahydrodipicolinate synthase [Saccharopolyspora taberi]|uniref:4-hydroxy-tetrahydrodipicolinate synthase n=1 Tax=Saccharopolyspora taberi TaxID=60895 RepID=A0ABN3VBH5_9PSEU
MSAELSGVLTALATPFTADGQIDFGNLRRLVDRSIDGGVDGVVACGSTGEFAAMTAAERRLVVEAVIDQAAGRVPVIAQTGAVSTAEAVELSQHAQDAGASVLMLVTPYYEPLTLDETLRYLRTVAGAVDVQIMLYNLPGATGVNLSPEIVGQLAREIPNVRYIKDTSADMSQVGKLIHHHGDVISTFVGWDSLLLASFTEGAAGVMAGTANVMPAELVSIHRALRAGELERARTEWSRIYPLMDAMMSAPFIPAVKTALNAVGFPAGGPRPPLLDLDSATAEAISSLATELKPQLLHHDGGSAR